MAKRLPKHLRGPFVTAYYDRRAGLIYLKRPSGEYESVDMYPSFFVRTDQVELFPEDEFVGEITSRIVEGNYTRFSYNPLMKFDRRREMIEICEEEGVPLYEADVSPVRRFLADTGSLVEQKFRNLWFDLETHPLKIGFDDEAKKAHRIVSWAAGDDEGNSWFMAAEKSSQEEERRLIKSFLKLAKKYDTLLAWNGDNYDFFVLKARCRIHKIQVNWFLWNLLDYMGVVKKVLMSVPDVDFKRSFHLDDVGENILDMRKIKLPVDGGKIHTLCTGGGGLSRNDSRRLLESYNRRDVEIMQGVEKKREFLALHYALCSICRTFPGRASLFPNELADGILLRMAVQEGIHFPTRKPKSEDKDDKYEGAYVMDPVEGFHTDVQVPDFAGLYPNIIVSWNMSNETKLPEDMDYDADKVATATATGVRFRTDMEGMIPKALRQLMNKRAEYAARTKEFEVESPEWKNVNRLSTAVKVATNSFYGLLGNEGSRYYDRDIARSVTLTGQLLIRKVMRFFEDRGFQTISGDTDSVFVKSSEEDMHEQIVELNKNFIPNLLTDYGCQEQTIKLDFDKGYSALLIVTKKRYAGKLSLRKGRRASPDLPPEIKGLEVKRSDQIRFGQRLQKKYIDMLLRVDVDPLEVETALREDGLRFLTEDIDVDDITITESVSKRPELYKPQTTSSRVAQWMIENGIEFFTGMKVPYVVVYSKERVEAIHVSQYDGSFDRQYYWMKRILPPIIRMVNARFPNYTVSKKGMKAIFSNPGQSQLDFGDRERLTVRHKRVRKPKLPAAAKKTRRVRKRSPKAIILFSEKDGEAQIHGVAKLVKANPGKFRVEIQVRLEDDSPDRVADIATNATVSMDGLRQVKKMFPAVKITPNPL